MHIDQQAYVVLDILDHLDPVHVSYEDSYQLYNSTFIHAFLQPFAVVVLLVKMEEPVCSLTDVVA